MLTPVELVKRGDRLMHPFSGWMIANHTPEAVEALGLWELEATDDRSEPRELWFHDGDLVEVHHGG